MVNIWQLTSNYRCLSIYHLQLFEVSTATAAAASAADQHDLHYQRYIYLQLELDCITFRPRLYSYFKETHEAYDK